MGFWRNIFSKEQPPTCSHLVPEGSLVYAVGDIHGRADLLDRLCQLIREDMAQRDFSQATIIFLGDYIDRGYHSREVIEGLINLEIDGADVVCLAGNHEDMMLRFLDDPAEGQFWLGVGGLATLASYNVFVADDSSLENLLYASNELAAKLPERHKQFLLGLGEHAQIGDYYFVHAGMRPGVPCAEQRREDKLGIRREFTESDFDFGVKIVHGHSGVRKPVLKTNRIAIDTGAFATGQLTAVVLSGNETAFIQT